MNARRIGRIRYAMLVLRDAFHRVTGYRFY